MIPVVAEEAQHFWFYWISFLLVGAGILISLALGLGYYVRVIRPKYRGRKVS